MQKSHEERSCCQEDRGIRSQRLFMPRKPLDIKFTDYPFGKEVINFFPCPPDEGQVWAAPTNRTSPSKKAGANVSIILGHFQKCLTAVLSDRFTVYLRKNHIPEPGCRFFAELILFQDIPLCIYPDTVNKSSQQHHIHTEIQPQHHKNDRRHTSIQTGKSFEDCQIHRKNK